MRTVAIAATLLLVACSGQQAASPSPTPMATATLAATSPASRICSLPVWWSDGSEVHAAFVSVPDGAVNDAGILPILPQAGGAQLGGAYGAVYDIAARRWLRVDRRLLSPDERQWVYWTANPSLDEIHVVDVATGVDRVVYSGPTLYIPISFGPDAIYVIHAINPRQSAFEKLYRLDPAAGTPPALVQGSDRHMYQFGWLLIGNGAAWGADVSVQGGVYTYSILRLDLATAQVTQWFVGPSDDLVWPLGIDGSQTLYVQIANLNQLWQVRAPGQAEQLPNPGPVSLGGSVGGANAFVSDSNGAWFAGRSSVWLYSTGNPPKQFVVGQPGDDTWPAGPCLLLPP